MKIQAQTENKTIEQNLIWLEHEIKINEAVATSQETKAKVNVLSLAISSISELSSTIRELKSEIAELRTEVSVLRSSVKPKMSDEEKAIFREEAREPLREIYNEHFNKKKEINRDYLARHDFEIYGNPEILNSIIDNGIEIIIIKSKTINEARRILKRLLLIVPAALEGSNGLHVWINFIRNFQSWYSNHTALHNRDYKIIFCVIHELERNFILKAHEVYKKLGMESGLYDIRYSKSILEGGGVPLIGEVD
jgi:hypothetical protein